MTQIIVAIIGAAATVMCAVITGVIVPWIKSKTTAQQQEIIEAAAETAVLFVQQTMADGDSTDKLNSAVASALTYLESVGITISQAELVTAVESALKEIKLTVGDAWSN